MSTNFWPKSASVLSCLKIFPLSVWNTFVVLHWELSLSVDDCARQIFYFQVLVLMPFHALARIYPICHRSFFFPCVTHTSCSLCCFTCNPVLIHYPSHGLLLLSALVSVKICFLLFLTNSILHPKSLTDIFTSSVSNPSFRPGPCISCGP